MSRDNKSPTIDDTLEANINIKWLIQIVAAIVVAVWFYAELTNRLDKLEDQATINNIEIYNDDYIKRFGKKTKNY